MHGPKWGRSIGASFRLGSEWLRQIYQAIQYFKHFITTVLCPHFYVASVPKFHKVPPQIVPFDFGTEPANVGEMTTLSCLVAKGDLPMDIFWSLNTMPILHGQHSFTVTRLNARTSALSVDSLDAQHRGVYKCMARNGAGQTEHHSALEVNGYVTIFAIRLLIYFFPYPTIPLFTTSSAHYCTVRLRRRASECRGGCNGFLHGCQRRSASGHLLVAGRDADSAWSA